ncbi:hypothetical protein HMPREF0578_1450 [Mobiluncus mulieris 28-1]|nr:hypothetical protein HMPREF0577_2137 [Mobiluncus mulieris ATCC 35243]EEZ92121.1 hypothetical protein HMPREF0578_1450 [Mobiluncus mulieris 28-1]
MTSTGVRLSHLEANYTGTTAQALEDERISLLDASHFTGEKIPTVKKSCQI